MRVEESSQCRVAARLHGRWLECWMEAPCAGVVLLDVIESPVRCAGEDGIDGAHGGRQEIEQQRPDLSGEQRQNT